MSTNCELQTAKSMDFVWEKIFMGAQEQQR
jgi:hypothetical protein